jgi:mono/diheme cytochrome c family protein
MAAHAPDPTYAPTTDDVIVTGSAEYIRGPGGVLEDFRLRKPPRWMVYIAIVAVVASWIPLAVIFLARYKTSTSPRIHIFQDMDSQVHYRPQEQNPVFQDKRAMRPLIPGTIARGKLLNDDHYFAGFTMAAAPAGGGAGTGGGGGDAGGNAPGPAAQFYADYPAQVQRILDDPQRAEQFLRRGQERYNIYCALCHAPDGYGQGAIHIRADTLARNGVQGMAWVQPRSLHEEEVLARPNGHLFNTITNGIRNMGGYGAQIHTEDRWAIVAYIRTLQFAQRARGDAVPPEQRGQMNPQ